MGPNLTRLFAESRRDLLAYAELGLLLLEHGEALIAALEMNVKVLEGYESLLDDADLSALESAKQLLAQLESEAQP